ncbi:MAG: hypothetical protein ACRD0G_05790, partial [Acidimicrobiales bacterium]
MPLPEAERGALRSRLAPVAAAAVDVVDAAVHGGEQLRDVLAASDGTVIAFTSERALVVLPGADAATNVEYDSIEVARRDAGLGIDARLEGGRLTLDVARGTLDRLAAVALDAAPPRASW